MISNFFVLLGAVNVKFKVMEDLRNTPEKHPCPSKMKLICLTLLIISGITYSRSEQYDVVGPVDPVLAVPGEDVILPCSVKPNTSVVDMRVEWFRQDLKDSLVHLYEDHEDRNTDQIESYRGRTKLNHQELQRGNASLKLSSLRISDEGSYKCFIQSKSWYDEATVDVYVEVVGHPPVVTVDGFDKSERLHLQCESEGWYPEPVLEWLNSEGVKLSSETTETHRNADRFSVKHTITVQHSGSKIHCRVKLRHHVLETQIVTSNKSFNPWRTSVILSSIAVALIVIAGMLIAAFVHKNREHDELQNEKRRNEQEYDALQGENSAIQEECSQLKKGIIQIQEECKELLQNENRSVKQELWMEISKIQEEHNKLQKEKRNIQKECDQLKNEKWDLQKEHIRKRNAQKEIDEGNIFCSLQ
ncbi:butyrophilin subfamily 3 member A2 isoform X1 [Labeo rohita]|uniref:butyrophilin subfamily 3 member A2 isoform X1 n=1 Tax=Labeo rohita TaxID=84645 RepID=UPI0021E2F273|nr:butyrophilin subfamily 3 member A2 isoform X1 [Labeo rohita]